MTGPNPTQPNPTPGDPSGPTAPAAGLNPVEGGQLLDGASTGTDEGPGGIPAALVGRDKDGDEVAPPPAALPGDAGTSGSAADRVAPSETSAPQQTSPGSSESARGNLSP